MNSQMVEQPSPLGPRGLSPIQHQLGQPPPPHQQQTPDPDAIKMFVGQIPKQMTEEDLREMFEEFGTVYELNVLRDKMKAESKGCCFVTFHKRSAALEAQNALHNVKMMPGMRHPIQMKPADCENRNVEERKLFVGMVAKKHNENDVRVMFSAYGTIEECHVLRDGTGNSRGCAFVTFSTRQSALNAIKALHHSTTMEGCSSPLVVKFADTQREKDAKRLQTMAQSFFPANLAQSMNALTPQYIAPQLPMKTQQDQLGDQSPLFLKQALYQLMQQALGSGNQATINGMQQLATSGVTNTGTLSQGGALSGLFGLQALKGSGTSATNTASTLSGLGAGVGNLSAQNLQGLGGLGAGLGAGLGSGLGSGLGGMSGLSGMSGTGLSASGLSGMNGLGSSTGLNTSTTAGNGSLDMNALTQAYSGIQQYTAQFNGFGVNTLQQTAANNTKQKEGPEGANLFIYHLPQEMLDGDLLQAFIPFGNVISAKVFIDKVTNMSKCFGFVSFDNPVSAQAAIQAMNGFSIGTKRLKVQLKRSKETGKPY